MAFSLSDYGWEAPSPITAIPGAITTVAEDANLVLRVLYPSLASVFGSTASFNQFNTSDNAASNTATNLTIAATNLATSKYGQPFRQLSAGQFVEGGILSNSNISVSTWASITLDSNGAITHFFSRHSGDTSFDATGVVLERMSAGNCRIRLQRYNPSSLVFSSGFALPTDGTPVFLNLVLQHTTQDLFFYVNGVLVCTMSDVLKLNGHVATYTLFNSAATCGWLGYSVYKSANASPDQNHLQLPTYMEVYQNCNSYLLKKVSFNYM